MTSFKNGTFSSGMGSEKLRLDLIWYSCSFLSCLLQCNNMYNLTETQISQINYILKKEKKKQEITLLILIYIWCASLIKKSFDSISDHKAPSSGICYVEFSCF